MWGLSVLSSSFLIKLFGSPFLLFGVFYLIQILLIQVVDTRGSFGKRSFHSQIAYKGIKDVLLSVYKEGGVRGLYRGVGMYVLTCLLVANVS